MPRSLRHTCFLRFSKNPNCDALSRAPTTTEKKRRNVVCAGLLLFGFHYLSNRGVLLTDSMPLTQASFVSYPSLTAIVCPLGATRRNLNFPALSLYHSNFASGKDTTQPTLSAEPAKKTFVLAQFTLDYLFNKGNGLK